MPNKMLIDATHPEETRVVVVRGNRVEEFDFETAQRKQLRGNIYLAKVTRVEPSLQAAFIEYGGNRHGFLAFSEIHPDYYQIPVADRQALIEADERAHREAEEESENRSNRRRAAPPQLAPPRPWRPRPERGRRGRSRRSGAGRPAARCQSHDHDHGDEAHDHHDDGERSITPHGAEPSRPRAIMSTPITAMTMIMTTIMTTTTIMRTTTMRHDHARRRDAGGGRPHAETPDRGFRPPAAPERTPSMRTTARARP